MRQGVTCSNWDMPATSSFLALLDGAWCGMQYLGYVSKALYDEVEGLGGAAHAAQDEDLLAHQAPLLTHLQSSFQPIPLAAHQERHQLARCIVSIQLHLHNTCVASCQTSRRCSLLQLCQQAPSVAQVYRGLRSFLPAVGANRHLLQSYCLLTEQLNTDGSA